MTNADYIRSIFRELMNAVDYKFIKNGIDYSNTSDEELGKIVICQETKIGDECAKADCHDCVMDWLKEEHKTR